MVRRVRYDVVAAVAVLIAAGSIAASVEAQTVGVCPPADGSSANTELAGLAQADQADRRSHERSGLAVRDSIRRVRVLALYHGGMLRTANDLARASLILQHGNVPEDYLLGHELAVAAVDRGCHAAMWLAAATEDRFLNSIDRSQRFGTQSIGGGPTKTDTGPAEVTDPLRQLFHVPPRPARALLPMARPPVASDTSLAHWMLAAARDTGGVPLTMALVRQCATVQSVLLSHVTTKADSAAVGTRLLHLAMLPADAAGTGDAAFTSGLQAALATAGITREVFVQAYHSLFAAQIADAIQADIGAATTNGRNKAFVRTHKPELQSFGLALTARRR